MAQDWKQLIEDSQKEIESLEVQREGIDRRIGQLKKIIMAAEPMLPEAQSSGSWLLAEIELGGITNGCRRVLEASGEWMSPLAVRHTLESNGLDLRTQKNAMASVHAVLKRLKEKGEVITRTGDDGGTYYRWRNTARRRGFIGGATRSIANTPNEMLVTQATPQKVIEGK